jgi:hypothetical protein
VVALTMVNVAHPTPLLSLGVTARRHDEQDGGLWEAWVTAPDDKLAASLT